jgi:hypothetical protein
MANLSPVTGHVFEFFWRYLWALAVWIGIGSLDPMRVFSCNPIIYFKRYALADSWGTRVQDMGYM